MNEWKLESERDKQSITSDWSAAKNQLIKGVELIEMKNVIKESGYLTEIYRDEWFSDKKAVRQVFQVIMKPNDVSAWHSHETTEDKLFVSVGTIKIVLFDARTDSETYKMINEFRVSSLRPQLIVIPPKVWHGIKNIGTEMSFLINLVDTPYQYSNPDHWRLPKDNDIIPYKF